MSTGMTTMTSERTKDENEIDDEDEDDSKEKVVSLPRFPVS
jgi:hypothetical protein